MRLRQIGYSLYRSLLILGFSAVCSAARVDNGLLVEYRFGEGSGATVADTAVLGTPLDLTIEDPAATAWLQCGGLSVTQPTRLSAAAVPSKIVDAVKTSNALSIEAWIVPASAAQDGPARIVTLSAGARQRNFTLGQRLQEYNARLRTSSAGNDGLEPSTSTQGSQVRTALSHVLYTRDSSGRARLFVDGVVAGSAQVDGDTGNWDETFSFGLANEFGTGRPWLGDYYLVAVYARALSAGEVNQNFQAGIQTPCNKAPVAEMQYSAWLGEGPLTVQVDAAASYDLDGEIAAYHWDFGDGASGVGPSANHVYLTAGVYTLTLTVTDNAGGTAQQTQQIQVLDPALPTRAAVDQVALYTFTAAAGNTVFDRSGAGAALDLTIDNAAHTEWLQCGGLDVRQSTRLSAAAAPAKLVDGVKTSGEITVEAWVAPDAVQQDGTLRIVTLSGGAYQRNFTLAQVNGEYQARLRTTSAGNNGFSPATQTDGQRAVPGLTHVLYRRAADGRASIFVDGVEAGVQTIPGDTSNWHDDFFFGLANEFGADRGWLGQLYLVAIYTRAIGDDEVQLNYRAGIQGICNRLPEVSFSHSGSPAAVPAAISFDAGASHDLDGDIVSHHWDFGDGTTLSGGVEHVAVEHTYAAAGVYTVTLTATDNDGASAQTAARVQTLSPSQPSRIVIDQLALYTFAGGSGATVSDISGVAAPLDLTIRDPAHTEWLQCGGLSVHDSTLISAAQTAGKIVDAVKAGNAISIEAWVSPQSPQLDGPARIVTLSSGSRQRNFTLGQRATEYDIRLRTTTAGNDGLYPSTRSSGGRAAAGLTHVLYTRDGSGLAQLYIDGQLAASQVVAGTTANWDGSFAFGLANEFGVDRSWLGDYYLVAVYGRALSAAEVLQNYQSGLITPCNKVPSAFFSSSAPIGLIPHALAFDAGQSADLDGQIASYQWDFGDGNGGTGETVSHTYTAAGVYTVTLTVTDDGGASARYAQVVQALSAANPSRVVIDQLLLYDFSERSGSVVTDRSGVGEALDLTIQDPAHVSWLPCGGLSVDRSTFIAAAAAPAKVVDAIKASNALSVEAWLLPDNTAQPGQGTSPARIVTLSGGKVRSNFTLGQRYSQYDMRLRTTATGLNGAGPNLSGGRVQAEATHVVYTRDSGGQARLYLNGNLSESQTVGGDTSNWADTFTFGLANEVSGSRSWLGDYYLVAAYSRALSDAEVLQNFGAGAPDSCGGNNPPFITSAPLTTALLNTPYQYPVSAVDPDNDVLQYQLNTAPAGMGIDAASGLITWTPGTAGDYNVVVQVQDPHGGIDVQAFVLTVAVSDNDIDGDGVPNGSDAFPNDPGEWSDLDGDGIGDNSDPDRDGDGYHNDVDAFPNDPTEWRDLDGDGLGDNEDPDRDDDGVLDEEDAFPDDPTEWSDIDGDGIGDNADTDDNLPPAITSTPPVSTYALEPYQYQIVAQDPEGQAVSYTLESGPAAISVDLVSGLLNWTPQVADIGEHIITVKAADGFGDFDTQQFTLTVLASINNPPQITSTPPTSATAGGGYIYNVIAADPDNDTLVYALTAAAPGMAIDSASGVITWTPAADQIGSYAVNVSVSDGRGGSDSQGYTVTVGNTAPEIVSIPVWDTRLGESYRYQLVAEDAEGHAISYTLEQGPAGMDISLVSGLLSWSPLAADAGMHTVAIKAADSFGGVDTQEYVLNVLSQSNRAPQITTLPVTSINEGAVYGYDVDATDPDDDVLSYTLTQAPAGMSISIITGAIGWQPGAPAQLGRHAVTVRVQDIYGAYTSQNYLLDVIGRVNQPPLIVSTPGTSATVGQLYSYDVNATDADNDDLTYSLIDGPAAFSINPQTGLISGIAEQAGSVSVTVDVTDRRDNAQQTYTLAINQLPDNRPPQFTSAPITVMDEQTFYAYDADASDADGDRLTYGATVKPAGLSMNPGSGAVNWYAGGMYVQSASEINTQCLRRPLSVVSFEDFTSEECPANTPFAPNRYIGQGVVFTSEFGGDPVCWNVTGFPSVLELDSGGAASVPFGVIGNGDATIGVRAAFVHPFTGEAATTNLVRVTAVSGPGLDSLSPSVSLVAFDDQGFEIARDHADTPSPYDILEISVPGIASVLMTAGSQKDSFDDFTFRNPLDLINFDAIQPTVKWSWGEPSVLPESKQIVTSPLVVQLSDDNSDGVIDDKDSPDVVFTSFALRGGDPLSVGTGELRAVRGSDGQPLYTVTDMDIQPIGSLAAADIDGDGVVEILVPALGGDLFIFEHDGTLRQRIVSGGGNVAGGASVADLDGNGMPEIIYAGRVYDNQGQLLWQVAYSGGWPTLGGLATVADIDLDGSREVIFGASVRDATGGFVWQRSSIGDGFTAVGNFDADDYPEIVVVSSGRVYLLDSDGSTLWERVIPGGGQGGAPLVADLDGDGMPEIGVAASLRYVAYNHDGSVLWEKWTDDTSSHTTSSTAFDFNGDGVLEVVYSDQFHFKIFDGKTGDVISAIPNTSGTAYEAPVVVDIDGDGHAEVLVIANQQYQTQRGLPLTDTQYGLRVYEGPTDNWTATRSIWNQHAYYIDNINDDGTVPVNQAVGWNTHNTFRLNAFSDRSPLVLPDLRAGDISYDTTTHTLTATISNVGLAALDAATEVSFYNGDPEQSGIPLGTATISTLVSGAQVTVSLQVPPGAVTDDIVVRVNELQAVEECQYENNHSRAALIQLRVDDPLGLSDSQSYLLNVRNVNEPPQITSTVTDTTALVGQNYEYQVEAADTDTGDVLRYSLQNAPQGASIDARSGLISWIPQPGQQGGVTFTVVVMDLSGRTSEQIITLSVEGNLAPDITSMPNAKAFEEVTYRYNLVATDPNQDVLSYALQDFPSLASIDSATGEISWFPDNSYVLPSAQLDTQCLLPAPAASELNPVVKWHWPISNVRTPPMVVQLTDDNGDAVIDNRDSPDIVFIDEQVKEVSGLLRVLDGATGIEHTLASTVLLDPDSSLALGDIDNDGIAEIIAITHNFEMLALEHNGQEKWRISLVDIPAGNSFAKISPSIADIDADGTPEIIVGKTVYSAAGSVVWTGSGEFHGINWGLDKPGYEAKTLAVDILPSPGLELIAGASVYDKNGNLIWQNDTIGDGYTAVGDFTGDGEAEIVLVRRSKVSLLNRSGAVIWGPVVIPGGTAVTYGGPPVVANMDDDPLPEIGIANASQYVVLNADGTVLWTSPTTDRSSNITGSSVFDFDGDGQAEVLYGDETFFRIYDGATGNVEFEIENQHTTAFEYPVVADIDSDGRAEFLVTGTDTAKGIRAFESQDDSWIATRKVWNQYNYHIDNIREDMSVPANPSKSWLSHNTFRLNTFPSHSALAQADLFVNAIEYNEDTQTLTAHIGNRGLATSVNSAKVDFYNGDPGNGGVLIQHSEVGLLPSGAQLAATLTGIAPESLTDDIYVKVNADYRIDECFTENNQGKAALIKTSVADPGGLRDTQTYLLSVADVNEAPEFDGPLAPVEMVTSQSITLSLSAVDPDLGDYATYSLVDGPAGLSINSNTGVLTWQPTTGQAGLYTVVVAATDLGGLTTTIDVDFIVTENLPPTITSTPVTELVFQPDVGTGQPLDLGSWTVADLRPGTGEPDPVWVVSGTSANQKLNAYPSALISDFDFSNAQISGTFSVNDPWGDDDYIGFVFGYQNPYQYYVFSWKRGAQGTLPQGMQVIAYNLPNDGSEGYGAYWGEPAFNGELLYSETGLGWGLGTVYTFELTYYPGEFSIVVKNGAAIITAFTVQDHTYATGKFGFYNASQPRVSYQGFMVEPLASGNYQYDVEATDPENQALAYSLLERPAGMAIDPLTGMIVWQADAGDIGGHPVAVRVEDPHGAVDEQHFTLSVVNDLPVITSQPLTLAYIDRDYAYDVSASSPDPAAVLTFSLLESPAGMTINATTGLIEWQPLLADIGQPGVTVQVSDALGNTDSQNYTLTVTEQPPNAAPVFTSTPPLTVAVGQLYNYVPVTADADGDSVSLSLVKVPLGLQMFDGTQMTWVPTREQVGDHEIVVAAADGRFGLSEQRFTVTVTSDVTIPPNSAPVISSQPVQSALTDQLYQYAVVATDADNDAIGYSLIQPPVGMTIDDNGLIAWTPFLADVGSYPISVRVVDSFGAFVDQNYTLTVSRDLNGLPSITSTPIFTGKADEAYRYTATATDPDNDTLTYSLIQSPAGMGIDSLSGLITWLPGAAAIGSHAIAVQVDDGRGGTVLQSYSLNIAANGAPAITSVPVLTGTAGQPYSYAVIAADPEGDPIVYTLPQAPAGMAIDGNGLITWAPLSTQTGIQSVAVNVADSDGLSATQNYNIAVAAAAGPNRAPQFSGNLPTGARAGRLYQARVPASDPDGDPLSYTLLSGPAGLQLSSAGQITWTPVLAQVGARPLSLSVGDGEFIVTLDTSITVDADALPLDLVVTASPASVQPDEPVTIVLEPRGGEGELTFNASIDGVALPLTDGSAQVSRTLGGRYTISASVSDAATGESVTASAYFSVADSGDSTAPQVVLESPVDGAWLSAPTAVIATVQDDNLAGYTLALQRKGADQHIVIAEGGTAVAGATIGTLDPSLQLNGQYDLILQAVDTSGQTSSASASVNIDGDLKVGNFSFSVVDLEIPVAGVPIRVTRTYDSRRRAEHLDFGYGWSVDYQNVRVEESRAPGRFWSLNSYKYGPLNVLSRFCVEPRGAPLITVTLPDGDQEVFEVNASPRCNAVVPILDVALEFVPVGDTQSTLEVIGESDARLVNGNLVDRGTLTEVIDPDRYRLTTRAGFVYELDQSFGIVKVITPNNHTLTYSAAGIIHSGGKSVLFNRDSSGKITGITDPLGNTLNYTYSSIDDLVRAGDQTGATTRYTYNRDHGLVDMIDPLGRTLVKNIYDDDGRLIAQEDSDGRRTDFNHNLAGRFSLVTDRNGHSTQFFYDERGNVLTQIDALNQTTTFTYDERDNQLTRVDALGQTQAATYNSNNDQLTQTDALGNSVRFAYNPRGQETRITDARGNTFVNAYDSVGNLLSVTDPAGNIAGNTINAAGLVSSSVDVLGHSTGFSYDGDGNTLTETDAEGHTLTFTYDANGNVLTESRTRTTGGVEVSETTTYEYDARNRVTKTTDPLGHITRTEYDLVGNTSATVDALGRRTEMEYDPYGRLTLTRYHDGTTESRRYDPEGNLLSETDRRGRTTTYTYDALNRRTRVTYADTSFIQTEYDAVGRVVAEIDANNNRTEHEYDPAGRRTLTRDALGNEHRFEYDAGGNLTAETDALGRRTEYLYNSLDQRTLTILADTSTLGEDFDALSRRSGQTDQAGIVTAYAYDKLGRLLTVTDILGGETGFTYDEAGNKLTQTDADNKTTAWSYDALGRVTRRTLPLGQTETYGYDANGNLSTHTNFNGQTATHRYDSDNRLSESRYSDGRIETFSYDAVGNRTQVIVTLPDTSTETTTYTYDARNRLLSETQPGGQVLSYRYDAAGNRTRVTVTLPDASTQVTDYSYDARNRLQSVTTPDGITGYGYDAVGNRTSISYPNGTSQVYSYDNLNRLTRLETFSGIGVLLQRYDYTLHPTGRRTRLDELSGRSTRYTYDALYRLTGEATTDTVNGDYNASYAYDPVGNRTLSVINGVSTAYSYDANDRLTRQGGTTYTYDAQGNTLTETLEGVTTTYTYDSKQQLVTVERGGVTTGYGYNPAGIRTRKTAAGATTLFIVDSNRDYAQVLREVTDGNPDAIYVYGDDLISQSRGGGTGFFVYDGLGSVRALSDAATGSLTDSFHYDAFGNLLNRTGTTETNYLFAGEQYDPTLNQYYLRARYYDQGIGRFSQMDTWMGRNHDPITLHKYLYGNADPVNTVDPSGNVGLMAFGIANNIRVTLAASAVLAVGISSIDLSINTSASLGSNPSTRPSFWILLATMAGTGSQLLDLVTSKVEEADSGDAVIMFHGSSVESLVSLLNGAPLSAATAQEQKFPGEEGTTLGFYLTPVFDVADFFGRRRGGGVIQFSFTNPAFNAVSSGSIIRPMPPIGSSNQSPGVEMIVLPVTFPLFDSLRDSGQIIATPVP